MHEQSLVRARPEIGSKYEGPEFDRPTLRRLPPGWTLDTGEAAPDPFHKVTKIALIALAAWIAFMVLRALA